MDSNQKGCSGLHQDMVHFNYLFTMKIRSRGSLLVQRCFITEAKNTALHLRASSRNAAINCPFTVNSVEGRSQLRGPPSTVESSPIVSASFEPRHRSVNVRPGTVRSASPARVRSHDRNHTITCLSYMQKSAACKVLTN